MDEDSPFSGYPQIPSSDWLRAEEKRHDQEMLRLTDEEIEDLGGV